VQLCLISENNVPVIFSIFLRLQVIKVLAIHRAMPPGKFAVIGLSESLAEEVKQFGVKVTVVAPGFSERAS
jgi:NADP-dependent 3-hydroxy acid dehydrogenase YdfG